MAFAAITAASMAELGHRGDLQALDDQEFGYPRYIGTRRWEPSAITTGLGDEWKFWGYPEEMDTCFSLDPPTGPVKKWLLN